MCVYSQLAIAAGSIGRPTIFGRDAITPRRPSKAETLLRTDPSSFFVRICVIRIGVPFPPGSLTSGARPNSAAPPFTTPPDDAVHSFCPMSVVGRRRGRRAPSKGPPNTAPT